MPHLLDIDNWHRRYHFEFFKNYQQPFFNLCAEVDVSALFETTQAPESASFFLTSFYLSLKAANEIEPFRYRIREDSVLVYEVIHGGSTILRDDQSFGFAYFDYRPDFADFHAHGTEILARARRLSGALEDRPERDDLIHYSVIPWVRFTSFSHAHRLPVRDSVPKIVFGKHYDDNGARRMPISVEVHHALVDGLEVGRFFERYQALLHEPVDQLQGPGTNQSD